MALKWTNSQELNRAFKEAKEEYDRKAVEFLTEKGEEWLKYARENGPYKDHTANLRNSIGYAVVQHGQIVMGAFPAGIPSKDKEGNPEEARTKGRKYADKVISGLDKNKTYLVLVAGMEYAVYDEKKGFWVLKGVEDSIIANKSSIIAEFARRLNNPKP
jgi:hypothetical protein